MRSPTSLDFSQIKGKALANFRITSPGGPFLKARGEYGLPLVFLQMSHIPTLAVQPGLDAIPTFQNVRREGS